MKATMIDATQMGRWEDYVNSSAKTVAWQSYRWADALARVYPVEFYPLAVEDGGTIRGILPLYRLKGPRAASRLLSVPFAVAGGMTAEDPEGAALLLNGATGLAEQLGASGITFKQYKYPIDGPLGSDTNYFNRELDLRVGTGKLWADLDPRNKRAIEAGERAGLSLEHPGDQTDLFYDMLLGFMTRSGIPCPSRRWIQTLLDMGIYKIALMKRDGHVISGTMVKAFRDTVSFPLTCMAGRGGEAIDCTYALYWYLLKSFAEGGYRIFHSGRMPNSEEADVYRLGWGGDKFQYHYQYYPDTGGGTEYTRKRGWKRRVFQECWKRLPNSLAEALSPRIIARFP